MEFQVITAGGADLVARLVDGVLVIVPPVTPTPEQQQADAQRLDPLPG